MKYQSYLSPIDKIILLEKLRTNPELKRLFKKGKNITQEIDHDLYTRLNGIINQFFTIHIRGSQGSMKTSMAVTLAKKNDPTFTPNQRVYFEYEEYLQGMKLSQPKEIRQIDEQAFARGTGGTRIIQEIQEHIEKLRKRQNSLIILSPEEKYFPEHLFTYIFETIDNQLIATCPHNPKPHEPRQCKCYLDKTAKITQALVRSAVKINTTYVGFYIITIDWNNPEWQQYETAKDTYMERVAQSQEKRTDYESIATQILKDNPDHHLYTNNKALHILIQKNRPNLTIGETDLVCEAIRMIRRKQEMV
jgi:hypothetical protein